LHQLFYGHVGGKSYSIKRYGDEVLKCGKTCILYEANAEENHGARKQKLGKNTNIKIGAHNY
jgi:hypothetical protein